MLNFYVPNQQGEKALVVLRQPSQMHLQGCQSYKPFFGFCIPLNHEICLDQKLPEGTHPLSQATVVLYPICPQPSFDYCISAKALTYIIYGWVNLRGHFLPDLEFLQQRHWFIF